MSFVALAADFDGTLAENGRVDASTLDALQRLKSSGKRLIVVTGRWLDDLQQVFEAAELLDAIVAENGSIVFLSKAARTLLIGAPPPRPLVQALRDRGVPVSVGQGVISTSEAHKTAVLEAIRELGLEWQVIFNKGAVMVLPRGVNKATGLMVVLSQLGLSPLEVVGIGDAENDHDFLALCGCRVAVANALPALKAAADIVTAAEDGAGVRELIQGWLDDSSGAFFRTRRQPAAAPDQAGRLVRRHRDVEPPI